MREVTEIIAARRPARENMLQGVINPIAQEGGEGVASWSAYI